MYQWLGKAVKSEMLCRVLTWSSRLTTRCWEAATATGPPVLQRIFHLRWDWQWKTDENKNKKLSYQGSFFWWWSASTYISLMSKATTCPVYAMLYQLKSLFFLFSPDFLHDGQGWWVERVHLEVSLILSYISNCCCKKSLMLSYISNERE